MAYCVVLGSQPSGCMDLVQALYAFGSSRRVLSHVLRVFGLCIHFFKPSDYVFICASLWAMHSFVQVFGLHRPYDDVPFSVLSFGLMVS